MVCPESNRTFSCQTPAFFEGSHLERAFEEGCLEGPRAYRGTALALPSVLLLEYAGYVLHQSVGSQHPFPAEATDAFLLYTRAMISSAARRASHPRSVALMILALPSVGPARAT